MQAELMKLAAVLREASKQVKSNKTAKKEKCAHVARALLGLRTLRQKLV
jgi:hypothetical protein